MTREGAQGHAARSLKMLLEAYAGAPLPEWQTFAETITMVRLAPGEVLFRTGDLHPYLYLVHSGLTRAQASSGNGAPSTVFFSEEGDFLASMTALSPRAVHRIYTRGLHPRESDLEPAVEGRALHTVTAVEHSVLVRGDYRTAEVLARQHHVWALMTGAITATYAMTLQADAIWSRDTPEDRYRSLLKDHPNLVSRLTQRDLASYLNVTEVTMSRMAKRVRGLPVDGPDPDDSAPGDGS